jgi:putative spermidine/putrescine transport system permease protein
MTDTSLIEVSAEGGRNDVAPPSATRRSWAFLGLVPFFGFLLLFLIIPAVSVFQEALHNKDGSFGWSGMKAAFTGQNLEAFKFSVVFSAVAALVGVFFGTLLAYAAATAVRPRWLRNLVASFSGVAANMGGIVLAFAFIALIGPQGIATKALKYFGWDLYSGSWSLGTISGVTMVYSYFNIPLMVLITLPAIDGLKASWREACTNLGGTTFTYWRRVGFPVLLPSLLGGFMLLFANSFSAYATAKILTDNTKIVSLRLAFYLGGDVSTGEDAIGFALAAWMILITGFAMIVYWLLRKKAERWQQ